MNNRTKRLEAMVLGAVTVLCANMGRSQGDVGSGTFQDLDFESANVIPPGGGGFGLPFAQAFPGWTGFKGGTQILESWYNSTSLGAAGISIQDRNAIGYSAIEGQFSAFLEASGFNPSSQSVSLSQTGLVPAAAQSIQLKNAGSSSFVVTLGGQSVPMVALSSTPAFTLYGGNIGGLGGSTEQLTITASAPPPGAMNFVEVDDIIFSSQFVPEPTTLALLSLGGLVLAGSVWRKRA
jgi:hypothetical protein